MGLNLKRNKTFKVIITTLLVIAFTVSMISCKEAPVAEEQGGEQQEEEKGEVTIPPETKEETPSAIEESPEKIEWEGMTFSPVEGLRFDKGTFYFMKGNEYGGEVGEKAGVCITDGPEVNGQTTWFGFKKEVLEVMQKKIMEEEKKFVYAFPIDLEQAKGIKIKEVKDTETDESRKNKGTFWDNNFNMEISNVPIGTIIYSPVNSQKYLIWDNNFEMKYPGPSSFQLIFNKFIPELHKENLFFKNERIDMVDLEIALMGVSLLPSGIEKNITPNEIGGYSFLTEIKLGEPTAEVVSKSNLSGLDETDYNPDLSSIEINYSISQLKNKNDKEESISKLLNFDIDSGERPDANISKLLNPGLRSLLEIENIPVFIKPDHD